MLVLPSYNGAIKGWILLWGPEQDADSDLILATMRDSALNHVIAGTIPLSELRRVLPVERMAPEKRGGW